MLHAGTAGVLGQQELERFCRSWSNWIQVGFSAPFRPCAGYCRMMLAASLPCLHIATWSSSAAISHAQSVQALEKRSPSDLAKTPHRRRAAASF